MLRLINEVRFWDWRGSQPLSAIGAQSCLSGTDPIAAVRISVQLAVMWGSIGKWGIPISILIVGAVAIYLDWPKPAPSDNLTCEFRASSTVNAPSFIKLREPITTIRISGYTTSTSQKTLYDFKGRAIVTTSDKNIAATATGAVFLDTKGQPNGLLLDVEDDAFTPDGLHVMTLGKDGVVDFSTTQAFVMADPKPGSAKRLSYPVAMRCRASK